MTAVESAQKPPSLAPVAGLASAVAMGVFIGYSMSKPSGFLSSVVRGQRNGARVVNDTEFRSNASTKIRNRIFKTYAYFASSIGVTGISAYCFFHYTKHSQSVLLRLQHHPNWYLFTSLISSIALLFATKWTNYHRRPVLKHLLWIAMQLNDGAMLSVLGFIGGPVLIKAALFTAGILGGISLISATASDEKVLKLGAYLGVALGFLIGMSAVEYVYPAVNQSNLFQNINIYGGLLVFGLHMAYDTKRVLMKARQLNVEYDPINEQMDLYLNTINFFIDMIRLILKQQEEERKRQQQQQQGRNQEDQE